MLVTHLKKSALDLIGPALYLQSHKPEQTQ